MNVVRAHVIVKGRVQGVFFRAETADMACTLGLSGWVRNLHDGSVEAVFEGDKDAVDEAIEWCWKGPTLARVEDVQVNWEEPEREHGFRITY